MMLCLLLILALLIYLTYILMVIKEDKIKTGIILMIMLILVGGSYEMADYDVYKSIYSIMSNVESINSLDVMTFFGYSNGDLGYLFTNLIFYKLGFNFEEYRFVCFVIFILLVAWECERKSHCLWMVLLLYFIYPLFIDAIQLRNTFVEIALLLSFGQLVSLKCKNIVIYILCLGMAATIHKISLIYIPFVIWILIRKTSMGKRISYFFIIIGACTPLFAEFILSKIDTIYLLLLDGGQYAGYVAQDFGIRRYIAYVCVLGMALLSNYVYQNITHDGDEKTKYIYLIRELGMYLLAIAPIFVLSRELSRVPRNTLLFLYVLIGIYMHGYRGKYGRICICFIAMILVGVYGYIDFYMYEGHNILSLVYNYNFFLEILE